VAQAWQPEGVRGDTNFVSEAIEHFTSHFELPCLALCPLLSGFSQTTAGTRDVSGGAFGEARVGEGCLESTLRFGEFCQYDLFRGNSAKLADETNLGHDPDDPFRRIDLPGFHSIPVVMLKLVVIVMIPLTEATATYSANAYYSLRETAQQWTQRNAGQLEVTREMLTSLRNEIRVATNALLLPGFHRRKPA